MKKIWLAILDNERQADLKLMVEVNLDKPIIFKQLKNGRIGFTQQTKKWYQFWK